MDKKRNFIAFTACAALLVGGAYFYVARGAFPPKGNDCYDFMMESLSTASANGMVAVPAFAPGGVAHVRCGAGPGFMHFEISGTDSSSKDFHIYETSGGMAASGGDSIFDYCYTQDGTMISGLRQTGRMGTRSDPTCAYDTSYLTNPRESYEFDSAW